MLLKWLSLDGQTARDGANLFEVVGFPTKDYVDTGAFQKGTFQKGAIFVEGGVVRLVYGDIYGKYDEFASALGAPRSEDTAGSSGRHFQAPTDRSASREPT